MRPALTALAALAALSACSPEIPGGQPDNYFGSPKVLDAQLAGGTAGQPLPLPAAIATQPLPNETAAPEDDIAAATAAALASTATTATATSTPVSNAGISDENSFAAVKTRESIESDAERLARYRAQYQAVEPTAVPVRPAGVGPNIVAYALSQTNPRGTRIYSRSGLSLAGGSQRNCNRFSSPDQAQIAFLEAGGPQKDRQNLDPDGDGYACNWDPAPFRQAVQN